MGVASAAFGITGLSTATHVASTATTSEALGLTGKLTAAKWKYFGKTILGGTKFSLGSSLITIAGTLAGTAVGFYVGNAVINNNLDKYHDSDGKFKAGKARWVKGLSSLSGAAAGFALTSGWGWPTTLILGGAVSIVSGIAAAIVHNVA